MAIENRDVLGTTDGNVYKAAWNQSIYKASLGNGVVSSGSISNTKLKVTESGTPAMTVGVLPGTCFMDGISYTEASTATLTIGSGHVSYQRYDAIVYDQSASTAKVIAGTAAANPLVPDVDADLDIYLGAVLVSTAEVTSIVNADIYDMRAYTQLVESCYLRSSGNVTTSASVSKDMPWNVEVSDTNSMHTGSGTVVTVSAAGMYSYVANIVWSSATGGVRTIDVLDNDSNSLATDSVTLAAADNNTVFNSVSGLANLSSGGTLKIQVNQTTTGNLTVLGKTGANYYSSFMVWRIGAY